MKGLFKRVFFAILAYVVDVSIGFVKLVFHQMFRKYPPYCDPWECRRDELEWEKTRKSKKR